MKNERLAILSCCAPCSVAAISKLKNDGCDFVVLFYNPNISPRAEFDKRLAEQIKLCNKLNVKYVVGEYDHGHWLDCVKGLENEPEGGRRCSECFKMRICWGAKWARENGFDKVATVFGASPYKSQTQVNSAGKIFDNYSDMIFDYAPEPGMYRQNYCGCEFSKKERHDGK